MSEAARLSTGIKNRPQEYFDTAHLHGDLKGHAVRGGKVTLVGQAISFLINMASTMILARLLTPADFGLVAMVIALTGIVAMFKDAGLSMATVQRQTVSHEQVSTLFWINVGLGLALTAVIAVLAPAIAWFYDEPRVKEIALAIAAIFFLGGLTVQHQALLRRQMRFGDLAKIQVASAAIGLLAAIAAGLSGAGYWALVVQMAVTEFIGLSLTWVYCRWLPGRPQRGVGTRPMLKFGGFLTAFSFVNYFGRNADNILIGNVWGSQALGLYAKAYSLLLLPIQQISGPIAAVATPALSRLQNEPNEFRVFFRNLLGLMSFISFPLIAWMIICREEIVLIVLGPQWRDAVPIYAALAASAFFQPIGNISGLLYVTLGRTKKMFVWGLFGTGWTVAAILIGLPYGAIGVAWAYSAAVVLMILPLMMFAVSGTFVQLADYFEGIKIPAIATLISGGAGVGIYCAVYGLNNPFVNLSLVAVTIAATHLLVIKLMQPQLLRWARDMIFVRRTTNV